MQYKNRRLKTKLRLSFFDSIEDFLREKSYSKNINTYLEQLGLYVVFEARSSVQEETKDLDGRDSVDQQTAYEVRRHGNIDVFRFDVGDT